MKQVVSQATELIKLDFLLVCICSYCNNLTSPKLFPPVITPPYISSNLSHLQKPPQKPTIHPVFPDGPPIPQSH